MEHLFGLSVDGDLAGMIMGVVLFSIPLVAILTKHQRQMAELIHGAHARQSAEAEISGLREEIQQLRDKLNRLEIIIDDRKQLKADTNIQQRLGE
jgi:ubiquinone biosynthesis protein UbiJ